MLIDNEKIRFQIQIFNSKNELIKTYTPDYINKLFKLPKNTAKVSIVEYDYINKEETIKSVSSIYLGIELGLKEVLSLGEKIIINTNLELEEENKLEEILKKRLLVEYKNDSVVITKVLKENEKAIDSIYDIEYYLKILSEELIEVNNEITRAKKLVNLQNCLE